MKVAHRQRVFVRAGKAGLIVVGGAVARPTDRSEPDMKPFASSGQAFRSIWLFKKQVLVMSTLSGGHHHGSDREEVPDWRECCRCGCRSGGELRVGLLS